MKNSRAKQDELYEIINRKMTALFREMEDADWSADEIALAIADVLKKRWLSKTEALREAREALSKNFVSDGNEG